MDLNGVHFPEGEIAEFCRRHAITRLAVFGSILRTADSERAQAFRPSSDVDVLVEFAPGATPGLLALIAMQSELSALIGRRVDLRTLEDLSKYFRRAVASEARVLHAA